MINLLSSGLKLYFKGDLFYYERPLLSHFMDDNGNHYLAKWCNINDTDNTWLFIKTYDILDYFRKEISLYKLVENADKLWKVEIDGNFNVCYEERIKFNQLEKDYLPKITSKYDKDKYTTYSQELYFILIDQEADYNSKIGCIISVLFIVFFIVLLIYLYSSSSN